MTDSELTRLAFKAAFNGADINHDQDMLKRWSPLTDDGDALRLAASLNLCVCFTLAEANPTFGTAMVGYSPWENKVPISTERYSDPSEKLAATRRAIVRAAAEIGKAMP